MDPESPSEPSKTLSDSPSSEPSEPVESAVPPYPPGISPAWWARAAEDRAKTRLVSLPEPLSLERELETDSGFALHGWHRMIDLTDYIAARVDGRLTGVLVTKKPETFTRVLGLASALKAAVQWFCLDSNPRPKFVAEAERYLAEQPLDRAIVAPTVAPWNIGPISMRSGPVVARKGGRGAAGRQEEVTALKASIVDLLAPLSQEDLHVHQEAYRDASAPRPRQGWVLACAIGDALLFGIPNGALAEMLREQGFLWRDWDGHRAAVWNGVFEVLDDADINGEPAETRADRLDELAQMLTSRALVALGIVPDKDLFRRRRS